MRIPLSERLAMCSDDYTEYKLLDACVGRLARRDGASFKIDDEQLRHIVDWLRAALANNEPWLKNLDGHGRPKKLLKFGSVDAIVREADKAMLKAAQRVKGVKLVDGDESLFEMLGDGYYVVRLLTPAALDRETSEMQHCIGNGGYDKHLIDGNHLYLSLRDQAGHPHVTIEVADGYITQLQGKQNAIPVDKYRRLLIPFIKSQAWQVHIPAYRLGYVIDIHEEWHSIYDLPSSLEVKGNLFLDDTEVTRLPKNLVVGGVFSISGTAITELPEKLMVGGSLDVSRTQILSLPEGLKISGNLHLSRSSVTELPEDIEVSGDLYFNDSNLIRLPKGFKAARDLFLQRTKLRELPENLTVGGSLLLQGTHFEYLPKGLAIGKGLYVEHSPLTELPEDIKIGTDLDIKGTNIKSLPANLKLMGYLDLEDTEITSLPPGLEVAGSLYLSGTAISSLPDDIKVGGNLDVSNTALSHLPSELHVRESLNISGTKITQLPVGIYSNAVIFCNAGKMSASRFRDYMRHSSEPIDTDIFSQNMHIA